MVVKKFHVKYAGFASVLCNTILKYDNATQATNARLQTMYTHSASLSHLNRLVLSISIYLPISRTPWYKGVPVP